MGIGWTIFSFLVVFWLFASYGNTTTFVIEDSFRNLLENKFDTERDGNLEDILERFVHKSRQVQKNLNVKIGKMEELLDDVRVIKSGLPELAKGLNILQKREEKSDEDMFSLLDMIALLSRVDLWLDFVSRKLASEGSNLALARFKRSPSEDDDPPFRVCVPYDPDNVRIFRPTGIMYGNMLPKKRRNRYRSN